MMLFLSHNYFPDENPPRGEARVFIAQEHYDELDLAYLGDQGQTLAEYAAADPSGFFNRFVRGLNERAEADGSISSVRDEQFDIEVTVDSRDVGLAVAQTYDLSDLVDPSFVRVDFALGILPLDAGAAIEMNGTTPEDLQRMLQASRTVIEFTLYPSNLA